jgi:uncharacterized protein (DUF1501 family)
LGLVAAVSLRRSSLALGAASTERRFVVVLLRGALDGMAAVTPYGDPALRGLRAELVLPDPGRDGGLLDLGGVYGLHPSLARLHGLYRSGQALVYHAVAGPYRSRSHFDAQDFLESGSDHRMTSGWLNRVAGLIPPAGEGANAIALGIRPPLLLHGPAPVATWTPTVPAHPTSDFFSRLIAMHSADPATGAALRIGLEERGFSAHVLTDGGMDGPARHENNNSLTVLARTAGRLLAADDGPRLAVLESADGWDTHVSQAPRLAKPLAALDEALDELRLGLGDAWPQTTVLVMTEFGRTVRVNGNRGTDHGTGTVAFVLGGAVAGGKVRGDWPGLGAGKLFEDRDLQPTTDLRSIAKGLLVAQFGLTESALEVVFPGSRGATPAAGLLRA